MKITGVKVRRQFVELLTDAGLTGIAIADARAGGEVRRLVNDLLIGADPRNASGLWEQMTAANSAARRQAPVRKAIAVLDLALWDLKAKANDEPLWRTLGGARPRANAYASFDHPDADDEELSRWFQRMAVDHGLRGGLLRVGADQAGNLRRLEIMRAALLRAGPAPSLMIDAGRSWSASQAVDRVRALEEQFDLTWVEGMSGDRDARGLKRLSDSISGAVCIGAGFAAISDFWPHLDERSADIIQIDIGAMGITGVLQIADAAFGLELPVTLSAAPGNIQAQLAGVMPSFMSVEVKDPAPSSGNYVSDVRIEHGWAVAGDALGNGLILK